MNRQEVPLIQITPSSGERVRACNALQHRDQVEPRETKRKFSEIIRTALEIRPKLASSMEGGGDLIPPSPEIRNERTVALLDFFVEKLTDSIIDQPSKITPATTDDREPVEVFKA